VALLRSFTVEPLVPLLRSIAYEYGVKLDIQVQEFNTHTQDILASDSSLYSFKPDVAILAVQTRDFAPELWRGPAGPIPSDVETFADNAIVQFRHLLSAFRSHSTATLIVHTLEEPTFPTRGILDSQDLNGQCEAIRRINRELRRMAAEMSGVYILDYDALIARYGREAWHDEHRWLSVRLPIATSHLFHMAEEWARYLVPIAGRMSKCLVVDLDNTLWGGIVGEVGPSGLQLSSDYPGAIFQELQRAVAELHERGILIAISSKNNVQDAMEVLSSHEGMILKPEQFAAFRINWNNKAQSLREIAAELNIGIDSLAFLDDNPVECELIRRELPDVTVVDLPSDPAEYAHALRSCPVFQRLSLSEEDTERSRYYAADRLRNDLAENVSTLEDFYRSLEMQMEISFCSAETLARVAQLTQKTNQFNLTTKRYTEQQITEIMSDPDANVYCFRVRDRFGDNGLIAVAITNQHGSACELDTLLMSCRVIGRTVETAILATIADVARTRGAERLCGWYVPTPKNEMVANLYADHGFRCTADGQASYWELDLQTTSLAAPTWIARDVRDPILAVP
jgi:FkbH-like protein